MKKLCWVMLAVCLLTCLTAPVQAWGSQPRIILYTAYRQVGWGDLVEIGCVDEDGNLWKIVGYDGELGWPYGWEDQIEYLRKSKKEKIGEMDSDDLFDLKGLISCAEEGEGKPRGWMNDAGTETSRAVRYDSDGKAEQILLGMSGDDLFENKDPNAQALYRKAREMFPFVRCYADESWGFQAVPLRTFLRQNGVSVKGCRVEIAYNDCEAGRIETEVTPEDAVEALTLIQYGWVTGKENATSVTGGTYTISFADENGKDVCWFTLYRGLLVARDGMYNLEVRYTTPLDREALTIGIGDKDYVLGKSTAQELVDAGWAWEQESDGTFGFTPEEGSWFYVETEDGTLEGAIVSVNLLWAYTGLSFRYCGCTDENGRLWSWLEEDLGGAPTEEGTMTAYANLTDGGAVRIETKDSRPLLTLIR